MTNKDILKEIKKWLKEEVKENQEIVDAEENNEEEICSDGTDNIFIGRHELADGLLNQIKKWEKD